MDHNKREKPSKPSPKNCLSYIYVDGRKISSLLTVFVNFLLIVGHFQFHQILILSCQWALFWLNYKQFESIESIWKHTPCSGGDDRPNWVPCGTCSWLCPNCDSGIKQTFGQSLDQFSIGSTSFVFKNSFPKWWNGFICAGHKEGAEVPVKGQTGEKTISNLINVLFMLWTNKSIGTN